MAQWRIARWREKATAANKAGNSPVVKRNQSKKEVKQ